MPRRCSVYECRGNYDGELYTKQVSFPTDESTRSKWIAAMPNDATSLTKKIKNLGTCYAFRGGVDNHPRRPATFISWGKSCFKQVYNKERSTKYSSAEMRRINQDS